MRFSWRSVEREREFEKRHILSLKDDYLRTDILEKVRGDAGYRRKVEFIETFLHGESDWILDIGSNTCGEAEYLSHHGYNIICSEINEHALDISKTRSAHFGRNLLRYVACDGHRLPFKSESVAFVTFNESLHHMLRPQDSLQEAARVLSPGGRIFLYEPYAYDPYRRISEVRDYFKGTIEKSFGVRRLQRMLARAGLEPQATERHVVVPSRTKLDRLPAYRRGLRLFYSHVAQRLPRIFGMVAMLARKPGKARSGRRAAFDELLECPITHAPLREARGFFMNEHPTEQYRYRTFNGIPVLIPSEGIPVRAESRS